MNMCLPDGVRIFYWHNPSDRTMALGSTQPLWVPGGFPGGKCGRCTRLTTLPPPCAVVMKSGNLNFLETSGPLQACNGAALPFMNMCLIPNDYRDRAVWISPSNSIILLLWGWIKRKVYKTKVDTWDKLFVCILVAAVHINPLALEVDI